MFRKEASQLNKPSSEATVTVSIIDSTTWIDANTAKFSWKQDIKGFDKIQSGSWCFLIKHARGWKLPYDLGTRRDWENLPPSIGLQGLIDAEVVNGFKVDKNVADILAEGGKDLKEIEGIIWSHWHFDHTGDPSGFTLSTKLIVGPGSKEKLLPGYPADGAAFLLESDFNGRDIMEIDFSSSSTAIGRFRASGYFGDGRF